MNETIGLDEAFELAMSAMGTDALARLVRDACPDCAPWLDREGKFVIDPSDEFDYSYSLDEWLEDTARDCLTDRRDVEAYGKPFSEVTKGMGAEEAMGVLDMEVTGQLVGGWRMYIRDCEHPSWTDEERDALEEALSQALGRGVDLSGASQVELIDSLDEASMTRWELPDVSAVALTCDVDLGDADRGLSAESMERLLVDGPNRLTLSQLAEDGLLGELEDTPIVQLARAQGYTPEDLVDPNKLADPFVAALVADVSEAGGAGWGSSVSFPCTLTAGQAVGLTHGGEALALSARAVNDGAWLGSFDPYMGAGGTMELKLARDLVVEPRGTDGLSVHRVRPVDAMHDHTMQGRPYSIGDTYGASSAIYETRLEKATGEQIAAQGTDKTRESPSPAEVVAEAQSASNLLSQASENEKVHNPQSR